MLCTIVHVGQYIRWSNIYCDCLYIVVCPEPSVLAPHVTISFTTPVKHLQDVDEVDSVTVGVSINHLLLFSSLQVDRTLPACEVNTLSNLLSETTLSRSYDSHPSAHLSCDVLVTLCITNCVQYLLAEVVVDQRNLTSCLVQCCNLLVNTITLSIELIVCECTLSCIVVDCTLFKSLVKCSLVPNVLVSYWSCYVLAVQLVVCNISSTALRSYGISLTVLSNYRCSLRSEVVLVTVCETSLDVLYQSRTDTTVDSNNVTTVSRLLNVKNECLGISTCYVWSTIKLEPVVLVLGSECNRTYNVTCQVIRQLDIDVLVLSTATLDSLVTYITCNVNWELCLVVCQSLNFVSSKSPSKHVVCCTLRVAIVLSKTERTLCCFVVCVKNEGLQLINIITTSSCLDRAVALQVWLILAVEGILLHTLQSLSQYIVVELCPCCLVAIDIVAKIELSSCSWEFLNLSCRKFCLSNWLLGDVNQDVAIENHLVATLNENLY